MQQSCDFRSASSSVMSKPTTTTSFVEQGRLLLPRSRLLATRIFYARFDGSRVSCQSNLKSEEVQVRRCPPLLESTFLLGKVPDEWKAVPDIWRSSAEKYGDQIALVDPYHDPPSKMTYNQLEQEILDFSEGLRVIGLRPDEKLSLFADNSCRWLVADQGIMATGAINVVRGSRSCVDELLQIYTHSDSVALVVDNPELFNRIAETFRPMTGFRFVILLYGDKSSSTLEIEAVPVYSYKEIIDLGQESRRALLDSDEARKQYTYEAINPGDIATLVYTSGTTGNPKGVMLTHHNLLHQIKNLWDIIPAEPGERFLSMLPSWHVYERACEYFSLTHGIEQVYTTVRNFKDDLRQYQPQRILSVPVVYETLCSGIHKQLSTSSTTYKLVALSFIRVSLAYMGFKRIYEGKCLTRDKEQPSQLASLLDWLFARILAAVLWPLHLLAKKLVYSKIHSTIGTWKTGISGGGSLCLHVDKFYEAVGVNVQNGYGLTESSSVIAARHPNCNVLGSVGHPFPHTEIKVVDIDSGQLLPPGSKGIVMARGPQIMRGYYRNPSATKQVLDDNGWLNTGDIGWIAPPHSIGRSRQCGGVLVLEGRAKDTIVLSTGENVEPLELEQAAMRSNLFRHIVVVGQDQRRLGAIIVPNKDEVLMAARKLSIVDVNASESDMSRKQMTDLLHNELRKWTSECPFQVGPILVVDEPFTIDNGLMTPTMKVQRTKVVAKYRKQIANLYE